MTAPLAASEAFPVKFPGSIHQPIRGGAIIDFVVNTGIDALNWIAGNGDEITFLANASANVLSTLAGVGAVHLASFGGTILAGHIAGSSLAPLGVVFGGPVGVVATYMLGFGVSVGVASVGFNEPIEEWLRDFSKKKK